MNSTSRINQYLQAGGTFNPELMEHDKVRDLLIDCREELESKDAVVSCAQAVLTALNVGDLASGSLLHLHLRKVMIAYRK